MNAVSDTSPLNYLILIGEVAVLQYLFKKIVIPSAVEKELLAEQASSVVRHWVTSPPAWLQVDHSGVVIDNLLHLDRGEREAIALAMALNANALIMDEAAGRQEAAKRGLPLIGTLRLLKLAHDHNLLDFEASLMKLQSTTFRASEKVIQLARYVKSS